MKVRLVVKGHVQGVGYRDKVMRIAREMHILGIIRNFDNGDVHPPVEIFCKCDEKTLRDFKRKINVKRKDPGHIFCPHVKGIEVYREGEEEYKIGRVPEGFGFFKIEYGDFFREIISSIDTFNNIIKHINQGLDKIDKKCNSFEDKQETLRDKPLRDNIKTLKQLVECYNGRETGNEEGKK